MLFCFQYFILIISIIYITYLLLFCVLFKLPLLISTKSYNFIHFLIMTHSPFTAEEYTDMVLIYGECQQNAALAVRTYKERYGSTRRCPTHGRTFIKTVLRLRENLPIVPKTVGAGCPNELPIAREEVILDHFDNNPETSLREAAKQFKVSHSTVSRILKRKNEDLP